MGKATQHGKNRPKQRIGQAAFQTLTSFPRLRSAGLLLEVCFYKAKPSNHSKLDHLMQELDKPFCQDVQLEKRPQYFWQTTFPKTAYTNLKSCVSRTNLRQLAVHLSPCTKCTINNQNQPKPQTPSHLVDASKLSTTPSMKCEPIRGSGSIPNPNIFVSLTSVRWMLRVCQICFLKKKNLGRKNRSQSLNSFSLLTSGSDHPRQELHKPFCQALQTLTKPQRCLAPPNSLPKKIAYLNLKSCVSSSSSDASSCTCTMSLSLRFTCPHAQSEQTANPFKPS